MNEYIKQAEDFCKKHGVAYKIVRSNKFTPITGGLGYRVTLKRFVNGKQRQYSFNFSDSVSNMNNHLEPTIYDVLACLQCYEVGDFKDFCNEFGYEMYNDYDGRLNKESKKIYNAVVKEYYNVRRMFDDCIDELAEIN